MGLLDTLANILTREPKAKPEYGPMSDALAAQARGYGVTGGLLNAIDPYILDPVNAPERKWVRQNLAAKSAKDMVAPSAEAMERIGMAGIFAGPNAKTANLVALKEAENLAAKGADNEAIRQATGWFKGMDGKWRFEIPDNAAEYRPGRAYSEMADEFQKNAKQYEDAAFLRGYMDREGKSVGDAKDWFRGLLGREPHQFAGQHAKFLSFDELNSLTNKYSNVMPRHDWDTSVGAVLDHKDLFAAYPELSGYSFGVKHPGKMGPGTSGSHVPGTIHVTDSTAYNLSDGKSTTLHELQHAIQEIEEFARGGSPNLFPDMTADKRMYEDANILARMAMDSGSIGAAKIRFKNVFKRDPEIGAESVAIGGMKPDEILKKAESIKTPFEQYQNLAGEIESSDVSARMNLTPEQRMATPPDLRSDAIVRYGNGPQMSVPGYVEDAAERKKNFERWFGDSKVVDADGKPLTVYHGTARDFSSFDPRKLGDNTRKESGELGYFFTSKPFLSDEYAEIASRGGWAGKTETGNPVVYPTMLSIKNPKRYKTATEFYRDADKHKGRLNDWRRELQKEGFDGVIVRPDAEEVIAFEPTQIKSIFNRGTYDNTGDILKSLIPAAAAYGMSEILPYD